MFVLSLIPVNPAEVNWRRKKLPPVLPTGLRPANDAGGHGALMPDIVIIGEKDMPSPSSKNIELRQWPPGGPLAGSANPVVTQPSFPLPRQPSLYGTILKTTWTLMLNIVARAT
jgi:hypothetical protein